MKTILLGITITLALSHLSYSQEVDFDSLYEASTIMYRGNRLMFQGEKYSFKEFNRFESSSLEYDLHKKNNRRSTILSYGGLAMFMGCLATIKGPKGLSETLLITSYASGGTSIYFRIKSTKHLQKAVWLYNRDAIKSALK